MSRQRKGKDWDRQQPTHDMNRRVLPHHSAAEASVLGGVILRNDALALIDGLETEAFYDNRHKVVFMAMRNLEAAMKPIDVVTLESEILKAGKLDAIGGIAFLGELTLSVPTLDNVEEYAKLVSEKYLTRQVMIMLGELLDGAYHGESEGEQLVQDVTTALLLIKTGGDKAIRTVAELIAREAGRVMADVDARAAGQTIYAGIPTGIHKIDEYIGGHSIGTPTIYVARPAMGKTTVAAHVAASARKIAGEDSILASYEDGEESAGLRGLAQESGISTQLLRARKLHPDDLVTVAAGWAAGAARQELMLEAHGMTAEALVRRLRRENLKRQHVGKKPIRQLVVDYLQKMPWPDHASTDEQAISHNSGVLSSACGQAEKFALVMFAQLNREVEKREDHEPRMSDVRGSGAVEQDGKLIVGIWRPWVYHPTNPKHPASKLMLPILKNHNGQCPEIEMYWDLETNTLHNSELEYEAMRREWRDRADTQRQMRR